jgi:hypothetical protein
VGLYHLTPDDEPDTDASLLGDAKLAERVNEAVVLGPDGTELWRQRKLSRAEGPRPGSDERYLEHIRLGKELKVIQTPIGIVSVVICLDVFADHLARRLASSPIDVLLIPSLSPKVERHRWALQRLVQTLWGIGFVCNRTPDGRWNGYEHRSFWAVHREAYHVPDELAETSHPSFVFKLAAERERRKAEKREKQTNAPEAR